MRGWPISSSMPYKQKRLHVLDLLIAFALAAASLFLWPLHSDWLPRLLVAAMAVVPVTLGVCACARDKLKA
jgi:hypothetical protein